MLFKEIGLIHGVTTQKTAILGVIPVYSENHTNPVNAKCSVDSQIRWYI
jgi:hypothetical protein